ncbi:hypothetical protein SteCoe_7811 [Stentor coeruleus]|uniref:Uncharacterized protein n=1 Tax=Stentor coeruleus TaxID=5963 RepID=A0A1R2CLM4_9CILI|nr:hypothetical protein SteCoe_7811 [Stentor coeruleus]
MEENFLDIEKNEEEKSRKSSIVLNRNAEYDDILESVVEKLSEGLINCFKIIPDEIGKIVKDTSKKIKDVLSNREKDSDFYEQLTTGLINSMHEFPWQTELENSMKSQWRTLFSHISICTPSLFNPMIDEITNKTYSSFDQILQSFNQILSKLGIIMNVFPIASSYDSFLCTINSQLKEKIKSIYIQLKLCPGVEAPTIEKIEIETVKIIKKHYKEWAPFEEEFKEKIEIPTKKKSIMALCCRKIFGSKIIETISTISYYAPVGWKISQANAIIESGRYHDITIFKSDLDESSFTVKVRVFYPEASKEVIWFRLKMEGKMFRKRLKDVQVKEKKEILVIVDDEGVNEIPEGTINLEEIE